jgi:hypothetical protein
MKHAAKAGDTEVLCSVRESSRCLRARTSGHRPRVSCTHPCSKNATLLKLHLRCLPDTLMWTESVEPWSRRETKPRRACIAAYTSMPLGPMMLTVTRLYGDLKARPDPELFLERHITRTWRVITYTRGEFNNIESVHRACFSSCVGKALTMRVV